MATNYLLDLQVLHWVFLPFSLKKAFFALFVDIFLVSKTVFGTW